MKPHRNPADRRSGEDRRYHDATTLGPDRRSGDDRRISIDWRAPTLPNNNFLPDRSDCLYRDIKIQNAKYMPWI
jgi:hypothetical protein